MSLVLQAMKRDTAHRSTLTQLRSEGQLAAVIYGHQTKSTPISLNYKAALKAVQQNGFTGVFTVEVEGEKTNVMLADIQRCTIKNELKHVDFLAINMSEKLEVEVPIVVIGQAIGVREGGFLTQPNHTVKIKAKPIQIPDLIEIDVSILAIGETLSLGDVRDSIPFEIMQEDDFTLAIVTQPTAVIETGIEGENT